MENLENTEENSEMIQKTRYKLIYENKRGGSFLWLQDADVVEKKKYGKIVRKKSTNKKVLEKITGKKVKGKVT